jgi:hypothetical protein
MAKTIAHSTFAFPSPMPRSETIEVNITRKDITLLLMETHKKCDNAAEEVAVLREVAKLNDLYPTTTNKVEVTHTHVEQKLKDLEQMSTEELLQMAGDMPDALELPAPIEGKYEEIEGEEVGNEGTLGNTNDVMAMEDL